jgi:alcohol dehydrogenase class IV
VTAPTGTAVRRDVRYGPGAIRLVPAVAAELGARRVLLVCGARSFEASGAARMLPELERVAAVRRWSGFAANTDAGDLLAGLGIMAEFRPDLVLGVGGGSAMDMAKLLCAYSGTTDPDRLHAAIRSGGAVTGRQPRLVLAPTTSGSGSEATHFAVVYLGEEKFSVAGDPLRPDVAVLDPALSVSGSRYQRATSGIDAVAQAIESLWAVGATPRSRRWARHALGLLLPAIEEYVNRPTDRAGRAMAIGSHLAGRAIDLSRTTAAHALSYGITKRYGWSHGHAVALTLGAFIELHADAAPGRLRPGVDPAGHQAAMSEVLHRLGATSGADARRRFRELLDRVGLVLLLPAAGPGDARRELVRAVNLERLSNNPVLVDEEQLVAIIGREAGQL